MKQYGPFAVLKDQVDTQVVVKAGDTVHTLSSGKTNFGGAFLGIGAPVLDANGDDWGTPSDYPVPALRKNSLVCQVGSLWYQGGTDASFTPTQGGKLILAVNDKNTSDNEGGWSVIVQVDEV